MIEFEGQKYNTLEDLASNLEAASAGWEYIYCHCSDSACAEYKLTKKDILNRITFLKESLSLLKQLSENVK